MPAWLPYTLARLGVFAVLVAVLMLLQLPWWAAVPLGAVLALLVSYLFLGRLRARFAGELEAARTRPVRTSDEDAEDR